VLGYVLRDTSERSKWQSGVFGNQKMMLYNWNCSFVSLAISIYSGISSFGEHSSAVANTMIFSNAIFLSPRSTDPT